MLLLWQNQPCISRLWQEKHSHKGSMVDQQTKDVQQYNQIISEIQVHMNTEANREVNTTEEASVTSSITRAEESWCTTLKAGSFLSCANSKLWEVKLIYRWEYCCCRLWACSVSLGLGLVRDFFSGVSFGHEEQVCVHTLMRQHGDTTGCQWHSWMSRLACARVPSGNESQYGNPGYCKRTKGPSVALWWMPGSRWPQVGSLFIKPPKSELVR